MGWKHWLVVHLFRDLEELVMVAQSILDAQTRLAAAVAAVDAKVDALIAAQTGSASPAEQDAVAADLNTKAAALEATAAKS